MRRSRPQWEISRTFSLGETGVFAAIGDPFDLSAGGRFEVHVVQLNGVPDPGDLALTAAGLAVLIAMRRRRATG